MTRSTPEPPPPVSREQLLACAGAAGITLPAGQIAPVLDGARRLQDAAEGLRAFLEAMPR